MELKGILGKNYKNMLNITVIIFALIIANRIYKTQYQVVELLKQKKDAELKKNSVLGEFSYLEKSVILYKNLLQKKDAAAIINKITNIANDSSVKITSIKPEKEAGGTGYGSYPFGLSVIADNYHILGKFISKLESYPEMYLVIESIVVRQQVKETEASTISNLAAELRLSVISFEE